MKRVMITGATGMIGVALINYLIEREVEVYAVCRPNSLKMSNVKKNSKVKIVECDISNLETLIERFEEQFDVFYHLGWVGTFGDSRNDTFLQNLNIKYTLDAVKLASNLGCNVFVGAGSQAEYGVNNCKLTPETNCNPETAYGIAKYSAGKLSNILARQLGIKHVWTRILSIYGPHDNDFTMIMNSIEMMLKGEKVSYTKCEQMWDYLYCDDAARAMYLMAKKGVDGAVYCLGSSDVRQLKEYIELIRYNINQELSVGIGEIEYYENQVMHLEADISSLTKDTGFLPKVKFEDGIKRTIDWVKNKYI